MLNFMNIEARDAADVLLLLITALLLIRTINKQHFTTRRSSRILSIIRRPNPWCLLLIFLIIV